MNFGLHWHEIAHVWTPMFRVFTEEQFNELDLRVPLVQYDENQRTKVCCACSPNEEIQGEGQVTVHPGGRCVSIVADAVCPRCGTAIHSEYRLSDGCLMQRQPNGQWLIYIYEPALVALWGTASWCSLACADPQSIQHQNPPTSNLR